MKHKGVRIELLIGGKTYLDIDSFVAHLQATVDGDASFCSITVSRGQQVQLRMTPTETDEEALRDEG